MSITHFSGPLALTEVQSLSTPGGMVDNTSAITELSLTGPGPLSLAAGEQGQLKVITMIEDNGDTTVVSSSPIAGAATSIVFNDVGDSVVLHFNNGLWYIIATNGVTIT